VRRKNTADRIKGKHGREGFSKLVNLVETLRGNKGCPWDKKQTVKAFKTYLLEEVYELIDSIEKDNDSALKEELGDLLFHILFISQICKENRLFDIDDVIHFTYEKMYNRHPHVFMSESSDKPIEKKWEEIKKSEKEDYSPLTHIPLIIPALLRAYIISKRVARVGFDWLKLEDIYEKMSEEIGELKKAESSGETEAIKEEIGDLLFTIVNISRFHNIDPEDALRSTSDKFVRRFSYIEKNTDLENTTLTAMDKLWDEIKSIEKRGK
jgi:tetrapyrrole methylase family protein/MazG family protein